MSPNVGSQMSQSPDTVMQDEAYCTYEAFLPKIRNQIKL